MVSTCPRQVVLISGQEGHQPYLPKGQVNPWKINLNKNVLLKGLVMALQFILFNFANYLPTIAMKLKVSKEITCK